MGDFGWVWVSEYESKRVRSSVALSVFPFACILFYTLVFVAQLKESGHLKLRTTYYIPFDILFFVLMHVSGDVLK